jgi:RNA polymerase sigma-70 factor (ECF subfamily)
MTHDQELQFSKSLTELLPYTTGYARTLIGGRHHYHSLYEDFAQTTMLKAWENRHSFAPDTNLKAWLFTILRNTIVSHHRRHWREVVSDKSGQSVFDESTNPEAAIAARQSLERVQLLAQKHRDVLTDIAWEGLSYRESARRHAVPHGTIRSRVARARAMLMELTGSDGLHYGRRKLSMMTAIQT